MNASTISSSSTLLEHGGAPNGDSPFLAPCDVVKLREELAQATARADSLAAQNEALKDLCERRMKIKDRLQRKVARQKKELSETREEMKSLKKEAGEARRLQKENDELKAKNHTLNRRYTGAKNQNIDLTCKNRSLNEKVDRLIRKLEEANKQLREREQRITQLRDKVTHLESKLSENSRNSNRPPSTDSIYNRRKPSEKKPEAKNQKNEEPPSDGQGTEATTQESPSPENTEAKDQKNEEPSSGGQGTEAKAQESPSTENTEAKGQEEPGAKSAETTSGKATESSEATNQQANTEGKGPAGCSTEQTQAQAAPDEKSAPQKRKARHPGADQPLHPKPTKIEKCMPTVCPRCGSRQFKKLRLKFIHQYIELAKQLVEIIHYYIFEGTCAHCGKKVSGADPLVDRQLSFGPHLHAVTSWLNIAGGMTRRPLQDFYEDVLGVHISQGGLQKILKRVSEGTDPYYKRIYLEVWRHWYNNLDETSWRTIGKLGKHLHWLWAGCNQYYACFKILRSRGKKSFLVMVGNWKGILISDDWCVYIKWPHGRQSCLAHMIRAARKLSESSDPEHARAGQWIKSNLQNLCKNKGEKKLSDAEVENIHKQFLEQATQFEHLGGDARKLIRRIDAEFSALYFFRTHPGIEPTNNNAERTIRSAVVLRKVMFGSASLGGEVYMERLLSLRQTCKLQEVSFYETLKSAMTYKFARVKPDLRWLGKPHWYTMNNFGKPPYAFPGKLYSS